jgi:hypothetical protein
VDEPTSATWYMPDTGGVHAGSSAPTESKYTVIPTEDDANYGPSAFSQSDISFNENVAVNHQIEPSGILNYTTTVTGLPTWLTFNGTLLQGTTPYVSADTPITITVTRANAYASSTGTFVLTITDNASLGSLTGWTELSGNFVQPNLIRTDEDALLQFDTTLGQGQQLTYSYPSGAGNGPPTIGILNSTGQSNWDSFDSATDTFGSGTSSSDPGYDFGYRTQWALRYQSFGGYVGATDDENWRLTGWSDNAVITGADGTNHDVEFKLEYANDGYIRLYRGGTLLKTSANTFSGDQTITATAFEQLTDVRIPTNWTITDIGAGSTTPPSGFVDPLLVGEMASTTLMGDNDGNTDTAVQLTDTLEPGKRYIFPQTWIEANVLPYMDSADIYYDETFVGVLNASPAWTDVSPDDFDAYFRLGRSASTTSHSSHINTASNLIDSVNVNSTSDAFYDYALEWDGQDLHVIACNIGDINTQPGVENGGTFSRTKTESNYSATGALDIGIGVDNGAQVNLTTTGLQKIDIPAGPRDIQVSEISETEARFDSGSGPVTADNITLNAGQTYRFMLNNASIESGDTLTFELVSDGSAYTTGVTNVGNHGQYLYYVEFAVPSDVPPIRPVWNGTDQTALQISGSTYVAPVTGISLEGPTANQTGTNMADNGDYGWTSIDETLSAGERFVMNNAFFTDLLTEMGDEYEIRIGLKGSNWDNGDQSTKSNSTVTGDVFKGDLQLRIYRSSSNNIYLQIFHSGVGGSNQMLVNTSALWATACAFIEVSSDGNEIRMGFGRNGNLSITQGDESTVAWSNWSSYKGTTGAQGFGITSLDVMFLVTDVFNGNNDDYDGANVDWTHLSEVSVPAPPVTNSTNWTKALDFSGSNEHAKQISNSMYDQPLQMAGLANLVPGHATQGYTSGNSSSRPWATAVVFKSDGYSGNQMIWNQGEGSSSNNDNIFVNVTAAGNVHFGWGREGVGYNQCRIATGISSSNWYGVYVAHSGERLGGNNATASNLADCFDIRIMSSADSFATLSSNLSTASNWTSSGYRMDRTVAGDFTVGGRGTGYSFRGKVASMVVHCLETNKAMQTDAEIRLMITDPVTWETDYLIGNPYRRPTYSNSSTNYQKDTSYGFRNNQTWLMGDGPNDAFSNIRNNQRPILVSFTSLDMLNMVSNDIETVNIPGLT